MPDTHGPDHQFDSGANSEAVHVIGRVVLDINGRQHVLGCAAGEESRLSALGAQFDQRVRELAATLGNLGEANLYLAAALTFLDERAPTLDPETEQRLQALEDRAAEALLKAAERIEDLAGRINR
jgi:cell division protein ZapA